MIKYKIIFLTVVFLNLQVTGVFSQENVKTEENATIHLNANDEIRKEIERINTSIEKSFIKEDIDALISLYIDDLTFFPEYKPALFEIKNLKKFYKEWFEVGDIKAYKKKIHTVEVFSDHILEIGIFNLNHSSNHHSIQEYNGKYMILWKRNINRKLNIVSEAFAGDKYIEPEDVPYAEVQVEIGKVVAPTGIHSKLQLEIEAFNDLVIKAVAEGDGETRANGFTQDAILMGNFDSIRVGMEAIRPIMLNRYKPGTSYTVNHTYYRIYDLGDHVFINAHYNGSWGDSINGGRFDGNMSNLMEKNENGGLSMHRQLSNRDSKLIIFGN